MAKHWHSKTVEATVDELKTDSNGLTSQEAKQRLTTYGPNELRKEKRKSSLKILLEQFTDILMLILLFAVALSVGVGIYQGSMNEMIDAAIILIIVIVSATLGFTQEYRSEKAVEALKKMTTPTASVLREGKEIRIPASELVPGDIILLYAGDKVPADGRLTEAFALKTDEASLTGESAPVQKSTIALSEQAQLNDRENMVFTGTVVVYGRGRAIVTDTGMNTEFGKIADMVQTAPQEQTPLEKRLTGVGKTIGILALTVAISVGIIGIIVEQRPIIDMVLWAISLAVAAVPEALPAIVTGALAIGMYRMAKSNAIVKRLPAVETLGSTSVICSDKTGTMTKGEMTVQNIYVNEQSIKVTGIGYTPEGEFQVDDKKIEPHKDIEELLKIAVLCNDSALNQDSQTNKWTVKGDPTEGALIVAAEKANIQKETLDKEQPRINEVPFSSERKRMTTIHTKEDKQIVYMKGAPEIIMERCNKILLNGKIEPFAKEDYTKYFKITEELAQQALRNLAFAYKEFPTDTKFTEDMEKDFVFVGIISMIDPPRPEVKDAIVVCKKAGIHVVMITGDHKLTATAVGKELGLLDQNTSDNQVLTGQELEKMTDEQLADVVEGVVIYARVSPEDKMRIVKAWKQKDQVVAMTGDGVNDAPALKMSDIGIAMGISGTEVSKEAADIVLADDNFVSIVKAVREGREIFENIKKYLTYLLQCNIMEIIVMLIVILAVPYLANIFNPGLSATLEGREAIGSAAIALTAVQLLWMNLVTDGLPAIALGVDPGDPDLMERKPRKPKESIFSKEVKVYLTAMPVIMSTLLLTAYFMHKPWIGEMALLTARTQLLTAMIVMELVIALSMRSLKYPVFKVGVFKNKYLWYAILGSFALQLVILYAPGLQSIFNVHTPELIDWGIATLFGAIVFSIIEIGKWVTSRAKK
ncbi:cation-translocating P-type ATPase [Candidatus Bathycorpusculum sp.]|uniref:cation-translocating P-type ATPase n=1 Tax=Candidatus Bathycorpusculum sp. TaxID=2994959 RepID=UPI00281CA56B|nr:cation-translocating P-type ATPase [Candidatus Termitimicrobium sp.]MCL2685862.1 cation-translocating P-type ATPase [Candidatus Termitimicrobium sp.]